MAGIKKYFLDEAKKTIEKLPLETISIDQDLNLIEREGGIIELEAYSCEKIEKVVFSTIKIHETKVTDETLIVWPDDSHHFPALWCTLTVIPSVMNVPILDFVPLMDFVVWPDYAEKYIQGVKELKAKALEIFGDTIIDKSVDIPSLSVYTFSPYHVVMNISDEGVNRFPQVVNEFIQAYIMLWKEAKSTLKGTDREFYLRKKAATRKLMKGNDPGYPIMAGVFGEDKTSRVFDIVF